MHSDFEVEFSGVTLSYVELCIPFLGIDTSRYHFRFIYLCLTCQLMNYWNWQLRWKAGEGSLWSRNCLMNFADRWEEWMQMRMPAKEENSRFIQIVLHSFHKIHSGVVRTA